MELPKTLEHTGGPPLVIGRGWAPEINGDIG